MIEVERKYRLSDERFEEIKIQLLKLDPTKEVVTQNDTVFLQGINSFKEFTSDMPVVRIRNEGDRSTLTYKRALNRQGDSLEHEVGIDNSAAMEDILKADDYRIVTQVTKDRLEIKQGHVTYALDQVKYLGGFLEIEILTESEDSIAIAETEIKQAAMNFGLSDSAIEIKKYDQLISSRQ